MRRLRPKHKEIERIHNELGLEANSVREKLLTGQAIDQDKIQSLQAELTQAHQLSNEVKCVFCPAKLDLDNSKHTVIHVLSSVDSEGQWNYWAGHPLELAVCTNCWNKVLKEQSRQVE